MIWLMIGVLINCIGLYVGIIIGGGNISSDKDKLVLLGVFALDAILCWLFIFHFSIYCYSSILFGFYLVLKWFKLNYDEWFKFNNDDSLNWYEILLAAFIMFGFGLFAVLFLPIAICVSHFNLDKKDAIE
jgi:hypothetical protein